MADLWEVASNGRFRVYLGLFCVYCRGELGGYMVMRRGKSVINFYSGSEDVYQHSYFKRFSSDTPRGYAVEIVLLCEDVEQFYQEVSAKLDCVVQPLKLKPWGRKDFRLVDPFGFYIRISERYNWINQYSDNF